MKVKLKAKSVQLLLARKNRSQNWLANNIGTTSGYMSQLMTGSRYPSPDMRKKIMVCLDEYGFDDLFTIQLD
jgi:hypothetical protein